MQLQRIILRICFMYTHCIHCVRMCVLIVRTSTHCMTSIVNYVRLQYVYYMYYSYLNINYYAYILDRIYDMIAFMYLLYGV